MHPVKNSKLKTVFDRLKSDHKVSSQAELGRQLKFSATAITQMIKEEKPLPFRMVKNLFKTFGVNANYIISDEGEAPFYLSEMASTNDNKLKEIETTLRQRISALERENDDLKQRLLDKEKIIELLERSKS